MLSPQTPFTRIIFLQNSCTPSIEYIERENENKQRTISSQYVKEMMKLLGQTRASNLKVNLNQIRDNATKILIKEHIFSRESFRTFIESYNLVKDAIEQEKK